MRRAVAAISLLFVAAIAMAADAHREMTTVEVVQVPVYVSSGDAPLTGLKKTDFELFVNGKQQPIDYFDAIDFAPLPAEATTNDEQPAARPQPAADLRQRRLYLLLFDLVYSTPKGIARAQVAADGYVDRAADSDYFAVGTYTSNHGVHLMVPFTRDRVAVRHAIQRFSEATSGDPLRLAIASAERAETVEPEAFAETAQVQNEIEDSAAKQLLLDPLRRRIRDEVENLSDLADRLAPLEGNRHVVLLTGGFDSSIFHGAGAANTIVFPRNFGQRAQMNKPMRQGWVATNSEPGITAALKEMYRRFTGAGVFLDCIDVEGNRYSMSSSHESEGLSILARDTGGQVVLNRNNLGEAIQHLADLQRVVYVLGFHARQTGRSENSIVVKLRNAPRGVNLNYRPSYSTAIPKASATDGLRIADIVENDIPQRGLTLTAKATGKRVDVVVLPAELIALTTGKSIEAEALMYVYSGTSVAAFQQKHITIDPARAEAMAPLHVTQSFDELPPGDYVAKVLLRIDGTDALGFARAGMIVE